jgi:hypothetical protein
MKKILFYCRISIICVLLGVASSCKKNNVNPDAPDTNQEFQTRLNKKWEVQSIATARQSIVTAFELPWFEFLSGDNKYVVHDGSKVYYGNYNTNATKDTIILNGFGIIAITRLGDTSFDFSLKKTGTTNFVQVFTTAVSATIPSSTAAELLCEKAWIINWQIPEGEDTIFYNSSSSGITKIEVRFSKNGTYLSHTETTDDFAGTDVVKYWKWNNAAQTEILTSSSGTFEDSYVIFIKTLTAQKWIFSYGTIAEGSGSR